MKYWEREFDKQFPFNMPMYASKDEVKFFIRKLLKEEEKVIKAHQELEDFTKIKKATKSKCADELEELGSIWIETTKPANMNVVSKWKINNLVREWREKL